MARHGDTISNPEVLQKCFDMWLRKVSYAEICRQMGVRETELRHWRKRYKWQEARQRIADTLMEQVVTDYSTLQKAERVPLVTRQTKLQGKLDSVITRLGDKLERGEYVDPKLIKAVKDLATASKNTLDSGMRITGMDKKDHQEPSKLGLMTINATGLVQVGLGPIRRVEGLPVSETQAKLPEAPKLIEAEVIEPQPPDDF